MGYRRVFIDGSGNKYPIKIFTPSELLFVNEKSLIKIEGDKFSPNFVGELITPENSYFSVPKNFEPTPENIELFKRVLIFYQDLKKDGKKLLTNNIFTISDTGEFKSERYYFEELKEFFLDYITYNFIYPEKHKKVFSKTPIPGAKIDVFLTMKIKKQKGPGVVYKVRDLENTEDWNLDDIYWSALSELSKKYSTTDDKNQIAELYEFLNDIGYNFKLIDISDTSKILKDIERCSVGIIHQPIKNTLIAYFENKSISTNFKLNIFYTKEFEYVWETIVKVSLKHDDIFERKLRDNMSGYRPTKRNYSQGDVPTIYSEGYPDLFSNYDRRKFIGDAKYYQDPTNQDFNKEMFSYNSMFNNQYPMCVFIPWTNTRRVEVREANPNFEMILFQISVKEAIEDSMNGSDRTIRRVQQLISKNTKRKF